MNDNLEKFIIELSALELYNFGEFEKFQRRFSKANKTAFFTNDNLIRVYHKLVKNRTIVKNAAIEKLLTLKATRSLSGIVVVSVLTKSYPCPGKCLYCPSQADVPKSYLKDEPAVMRAITCKYDPYLQTISRIKALDSVGHSTDKICIRVVGGTWSYYPAQYQTWFLKSVFAAANGIEKVAISKYSMEELQKLNESAKNRLVEISVETRQDYINVHEIKRLRDLGITKVELGVQSIYDDILKKNNRGNSDEQTVQATKLLKDAGFKVSYQMMLNLLGSDEARDLKMFETLFSDEKYQPDHLKIYPLALLEEAEIYKSYLAGKFKPYTKEKLVDLITKIKSQIPYYTRVERVIRDIPADNIVEGGAKASNLRQVVMAEMAKGKVQCHCIRCREVSAGFELTEKFKIFRENYKASGGDEIFLSVENLDRSKLHSMLRLRIPSNIFTKTSDTLSILDNSSLIRELHTYGPQMKIGQNEPNAAQHQGFGKMLIDEAEKISRNEYLLNKIAVISGVGVRPYFRKFGYELSSTYMVKKIG
jgi:elongator complex protein 3